eukprot:TRINITY_DN31847_c0_g1_i1.p1 TRINITY_DN31847_c0_g1~~TRINITY_DN31847_c0_g1_i1.p1  ORF type:complete len:511 (+),score=66.59 TRINITY_DN31847_c0_g1_i1:178-1710(+)
MGAGASFWKSGSSYTSPSTVSKDGGVPPCQFGAACYNHDPEHRKQFSHPSEALSGPHRRRACKYGFRCENHEPAHLHEFVHPGDRNYRLGLVVFQGGQQPEFETIWQIFNYHDPEESGHLTREEFDLASRACLGAADAGLLDSAWCDLGGENSGTVNWARFASWAHSRGVDLPVGLDRVGAKRPCSCRLQTNDGTRFRCSCEKFEPHPELGGLICVCGHKASMHRSTAAELSLTNFAPPTELPWDQEGLVPVDDRTLLQQIQRLLKSAHKPTDNWTRDRGCTIHGVGRCALSCAAKNRAPVPKGFALKKVFRNQNLVLWQRYALAKSAIADECARGAAAVAEGSFDLPLISSAALDTQLDEGCNEWRCFHGSAFKAGHSICSSNFRPVLAGTGATWKDPGKDKGVPLYGFGIYLAESITKADEYCKPVFDPQIGADVCAVLIVRCVGGRANVITTNDIDTEKLRKDVFDGPYHSVLGDRVSSLAKPFREIVIYDKDQCFPEFLVIYEREY